MSITPWPLYLLQGHPVPSMTRNNQEQQYTQKTTDYLLNYSAINFLKKEQCLHILFLISQLCKLL